MAVLRFPEENLQVNSQPEIREALAPLGIDYERWSLDRVPPDASADEVLRAYADEIEEMKRRGGYVTADVIDVNPATPNLEAMLARFDKEHTHDEDEVRFILSGVAFSFCMFMGGLLLSRSALAICCACRVEPRIGSLLRRSAHPRHSLVPGHGRLESTLHGVGRGSGLSAALLRAYLLLGRALIEFLRMTAIEPRVYLLDVEGTVAPLSLVSEQLFPYARAHVAGFLKQNLSRPEVQSDLNFLPRRTGRSRVKIARRLALKSSTNCMRAPIFCG